MEQPNSPTPTPGLRIPERVEAFLRAETIAGLFETGKHTVGAPQ